MKKVAHVWWFTSISVGKLFPRIAWRILVQVVSSSSCEQNWSSYSFVHSKVRNRLLSSCVEDSVYVYTNLRVLNQNVPFTDEAAIEWYKQSIISEDSNFEGPTDLLMITMMFPTLTHQSCLPTMRIPKGNQKNRTSCNCKVKESKKMGGTSKTRLHKISTDCTLNHQENASKACLLLILLVVMHH